MVCGVRTEEGPGPEPEPEPEVEVEIELERERKGRRRVARATGIQMRTFVGRRRTAVAARMRDRRRLLACKSVRFSGPGSAGVKCERRKHT